MKEKLNKNQYGEVSIGVVLYLSQWGDCTPAVL